MSRVSINPASGAFGGTSCDATVGVSSGAGTTFALIRVTATGNTAIVATDQILSISLSTGASNYTVLERPFVSFSLSSVPSGATIISATLTIRGNTKFNTLGSPDLHVAKSTQALAGTLAQSDLSLIERTSFGSISYAGFSATGNNVITLNAAGLAYITSVVGSAALFVFQLSWDIDNQEPTFIANKTGAFTFKSADSATDPTLTINYIPAITFSFDGVNANKLMGADTTLEYSLDGGVVYSACTADISLTSVIANIIEQFGIKIRITASPGTIVTITIGHVPSAPAIAFPRFGSNKNKLLGSTSLMEYSTNGGSTYTICSTDTDLSAVNLEDIAAILVRVKATGTTPSGRTTSIGLDPVMTKLTVPQLVNLVKVHHESMFEVQS